ncbi:MAG: acetyl-CoA C-acetyltransferase [Hyphomicrobium sp.]|uniref:acetyl-CoA C-acetyltransferase n=1 Tax=Hyphomicrobium sp. TaxID=82 RepID=UPI0013248B32|nr:acetyl-CoA C-acetyltransferase [Hyphomicrobium sp.]KAB2940787.1 MAG: acetyl-CoA C-acetyltransferase [Hyphomicrobium sp.]MBZ0211360.1 acetyl-CoA C-acetyltransferase [Hyphomicrobium sp.]MCZ7595385.1 acetyl-CoA C-acetyltransferase [Hyphomicrobium sp.]
MQRFLRRVAVIGGARIPFCRSNSFYADLSNLDLMTGALNALIDRYNLKGQHIDEVVGGAVITHSKDFNLTREAVLGTRLKPSTPGITMMQACGTSLQGGIGSAAKIATGEIECAIAVGSDTTSDAPIVVSKKLAQRLTKAAQQKTFMDKLKVFKGFAPGELVPAAPANAEPRTGLSMGEHAELMAQEWGITRAEQDAFALESHRKTAEAYRSGYMDDLVTPFAGVYRDNNIRLDATPEKLATLKTAFEKGERGTLTAANSTPLTDGAAAVLLASEDWAKKHGLPVQAYLSYSQTAANDFVGGDGLLMAPTIAVSKMLERAGLKLQDFDFYEIHEAFAAQVLATLKAWEDPVYCKEVLGRAEPLGSIDRAKLNVRGSSIAMGHPFAATGARIVGNLAKLLSQQHGRGLISICTAGGMGVAAIMESKDAAELHQAA